MISRNVQNLSLYKIGVEYQMLFNRLYDQETGEIDMNVQAQIDALEPSVDKKCIALGNWIKRMEADKKQIEYMKEEILKRDAAYEKEINKWTQYLHSNMTRLKMTEAECPYFTIKVKSNPYSTEITNASILPPQFIKTRTVTKTESSPDKNAIKEEVRKTGVQIPGALVHQKTKLEMITKKV